MKDILADIDANAGKFGNVMFRCLRHGMLLLLIAGLKSSGSLEESVFTSASDGKADFFVSSIVFGLAD